MFFPERAASRCLWRLLAGNRHGNYRGVFTCSHFLAQNVRLRSQKVPRNIQHTCGIICMSTRRSLMHTHTWSAMHKHRREKRRAMSKLNVIKFVDMTNSARSRDSPGGPRIAEEREAKDSATAAAAAAPPPPPVAHPCWATRRAEPSEESQWGRIISTFTYTAVQALAPRARRAAGSASRNSGWGPGMSLHRRLDELGNGLGARQRGANQWFCTVGGRYLGSAPEMTQTSHRCGCPLSLNSEDCRGSQFCW